MGAEIIYRPFLLGGVFQATGNKSPMEVPAKGSYVLEDLKRFARRYGVALEHNPHFPINTLTLMRGAVGLQLREPARMVPYVDAVFRAIWVEGRNMGDPSTVGAVLQAAGFDAGQLPALTADPEVKERLKTTTQEAVTRGVFGAPTCFCRRPDVLGPGPAGLHTRSAGLKPNPFFTQEPETAHG